MLLDCANCGAPLDVKPGAWMATCAYCRRTQQVRAKMREAAPTPPGWRPPVQWTPPPAARVHRVMSYDPARAARKQSRFIRFAVLVPILVTLGLGLLPVVMPLVNAAMTSWTWDGRETFECGGNERKTLRDVDVKARANPAIRVRGNCQLTIESSRLRAKSVVDVRENGRVTIKDSELVMSGARGISVDGNFGAVVTNTKLRLEAKGQDDVTALETRGNASVRLEGGELTIVAPSKAAVTIARSDGNGDVELQDVRVTVEGAARILLSQATGNGRILFQGGSLDAGGRDVATEGAHELSGFDLGKSKIAGASAEEEGGGEVCAEALRCCRKVLGPARCRDVERMPPVGCAAALRGYRQAGQAAGLPCD